jgi:hypothetical protein
MGRSVNLSPASPWALRALPGENKDPDSRHKCHAGKTRPSRPFRSRRSAFAGVEADEVELALLEDARLGTLIVASHRDGRGTTGARASWTTSARPASPSAASG